MKINLNYWLLVLAPIVNDLICLICSHQQFFYISQSELLLTSNRVHSESEITDLLMDNEDDLLDILLSAASERSQQVIQNNLKEVDIFKSEQSESQNKPLSNTEKSYTDNEYFEDEEDNEKKFSNYGKFSYHSKENSKNQTSSWKEKPLTPGISIKSTVKKENVDVYTDPFFGIRIVNPLISSSILQDRMIGREAVTISKLTRFIQTNGKERDWVIAGVVVNKSTVKTTQKGKHYSIWTITDLKDDIKTIALFLFSSAHAELWKTSVGTVIGILNPNILDSKDGSKDEVGVINVIKILFACSFLMPNSQLYMANHIYFTFVVHALWSVFLEQQNV